MLLVTAAEMRDLDERTITGIGVPGVVLMESAGRAVADLVGRIRTVAGARVAVVAGPGNNGGDGFVVARHLHDHGAVVDVLLAAEEDKVKGDARVHFEAMRNAGVVVHDAGPAGFEAAAHLIDGADLIIDALLGTGATRAVEGHLALIIERINGASGVRVAVDVPSGIDVDRGHPSGACVRAHHTVTFAFAKLGLVTSPGFTFTGELHVADIGIPARLAENVKRRLLDRGVLDAISAPRPALSHKGTFGHLLVVAGSFEHPGAAVLTAEAAARAGAGLVTIAAPDETARALAARVREVSIASLGPEPLDGDWVWSRLEPLLHGKRAVALGPGIPRTPGMKALLEKLLATWDGACVIDADGLNLLAECLADGHDPISQSRCKLVLTPHPAEMARLAATTTENVQADRVGIAGAFADAGKLVVALKGARTVVAAPDGRIAINPTGNPGLASGGTGDVLTGVVGALLASGLDPFDAACAAVYWHGRAADVARDEVGEAGLLASDVIARLPGTRRG